MDCFAFHATVWCHKAQFLSNICNSTVRDLTDALLSLILCQICSFISRFFKFSRIWWNYSILHPCFKWHDCLIHALFLSLQYQVPVYWSYFDLRRGEDQWQPKKKDECDVLFTALHFAFSLFFHENIFVNSRSDFNLQIWLKPFELLMVVSDVNLSVCSSSIDSFILILRVFFKLKWRCVILTCMVNYLDFMPWQMQFKHV